jgi:L-threonylcarbamoyladenylate synthase
LIVDGGRCRYTKASTVLRVREVHGLPRITVLREGVYDQRYIRKLLRWTMLLVCSGNTCRSPMAAGLARQLLAQRHKISVEALEDAGVGVVSAGVFARPGAPASAPAVAAMAPRGVDLTSHRARPLTPEMVREADVVYCMTDDHRQEVIDMAPGQADKVFTLDPAGDIEDPIGGDEAAYQRCVAQLRQALELRLKEQPS